MADSVKAARPNPTAQTSTLRLRLGVTREKPSLDRKVEVAGDL
jgi:hypothetical protein